MTISIQKIIETALSDLKAHDVTILDVSKLTDVTDTLIIATGTSNRHVKSLANNVVVDAKAAGEPPSGIEGADVGEWALVDFGDIVVHIMLQVTRDFYELEKLWSMEPSSRKQRDEE